jgi:formamidopyrimidine-DNA glycosylase
MPEVVEVCYTAIYLNDKLKDSKITNIKILGGRYSRHPMRGLNYFKQNLPMKVKKVDSKGKFLWFELYGKSNNDFYILNRFGLEGGWGFTKQNHSGVEFTIKDKNNKIKKLYFTDMRNFGTIEMTSRRSDLDKELNMLGPDFLKTSFTEKEFYGRIENYILNKKGEIIKSRGDKEIIKVLMDQKSNLALGSGLGNYLAVEALYRAKISPYKKVKNIYEDRKLSNKLSKAIKYVVKLSYRTATIGYFTNLDQNWIKKFRSNIDEKNKYNFHPNIKIGNAKFKFNVYRQKTDPKGNKVKGDKIINGRTTYWTPSIQK